MVLASTAPSDEAQPSDPQNEFAFPAPPGKKIPCLCVLLEGDADQAMIGLPGSAMEVEEDILLDDEPEAMEPDHSAEHTDAIHPDMVSVYFEFYFITLINMVHHSNNLIQHPCNISNLDENRLYLWMRL